ncbi:MAG TPA: hypothetical protein VLV88_11795 [Terriglobales bacterium]|nr:hypothetical protein [Terriglobales bacterium]
MRSFSFLLVGAVIPALPLSLALCPCFGQLQQEEVRGSPAEPSDAAETRAQIAQVEKLLPGFADRGAAFYFIASAHRHLGETLDALSNLKKCVDLQEGFDPSGDPAFAGLQGSHDFDSLVEKAQRDFRPVSHARVAVWTDERDLIPYGLAWDSQKNVFYLSSLNRRKIIQLTPDSHASDFVASARDHLLPVRGIRVAPSDGTVWAASSTQEGESELLHFDSSGNLIGRFSPPHPGPHTLNDLVITARNEIFATDGLGNTVLRFDPATKAFSKLTLHRPVFYPSGIALDPEGNILFLADSLGVIRVNLADGSDRDVDPGRRNTLAGASGLYFRAASLIAIQNGIGSPRVAAFKLSQDGSRVSHATILEYRTTLTSSPTTGVIRGSDFYFITNSHTDNLLNNMIRDPTQLEPVRIAVVSLP